MSDFIISQIRTWVPVIVGAFLVWAATELDIVIPEDAKLGVITASVALVTGLYYLIVSWLSKRWPRAGWLLGYPTKPTYVVDELA